MKGTVHNTDACLTVMKSYKQIVLSSIPGDLQRPCVIIWESRDGKVVKSAGFPPMWPRFNSWTRHHMWVEFVVGSCFFSGFSGFPPSSKSNIISKIPIRPGTHSHLWNELFGAPWVNKLHLHLYLHIAARSVLLENTPIAKFMRNYIRDLSGVFSISSLVRILMLSFPAFLRCLCKQSVKNGK